MKLKIDENLPSESLELLRVAGYDAITVVEEGLAGAEDAALAEVCKAEQRVFVTLDADFADIRSYPPKQFRGIVVLRVRTYPAYSRYCEVSSKSSRRILPTASSGSSRRGASECASKRTGLLDSSCLHFRVSLYRFSPTECRHAAVASRVSTASALLLFAFLPQPLHALLDRPVVNGAAGEHRQNVARYVVSEHE